jgi:hypothetical protein
MRHPFQSYCGTVPWEVLGSTNVLIAKFSTDPLPDVDDRPGSNGLSGGYSIPSFAIIAEVVIHRIATESNLVLVAVSAPRVKAMQI